MTFQGAVIQEQGVRFAIIVVKPHVIQNSFTARETIRGFQPAFPGIPVVLMAQNGRGTPTYYGRPDIAKFMARVPIQAVPWRRFTIH